MGFLLLLLVNKPCEGALVLSERQTAASAAASAPGGKGFRFPAVVGAQIEWEGHQPTGGPDLLTLRWAGGAAISEACFCPGAGCGLGQLQALWLC